MATIEVSTWAQLRSAITTAAAGDVIKLIADIDCNNEIPEGASTITTSANRFTVDGSYIQNGVTKNHEIRNLRTTVSNPSTIFMLYSNAGVENWTTKYFKNIDFVNLILDKPLFTTKNISNLELRNCRFTGKRTDFLVGCDAYDSNISTTWMYSCYFNIPYYGTSTSKIPLIVFNSSSSTFKRSYAHYCRFKETYTGTWNPSTYTDAECCGVSNTWLNGCRVEGTIVNGYSVYFHLTDVINMAVNEPPPMQNVYDVDFKLTNRDTAVEIQAFKGVVKIPVRKYSDNTPYGVASYSTGVIPADESQMKDTDWLIQHNFDVVPSNT